MSRRISRGALFATAAIGLTGLVAVPAYAANAPVLTQTTKITPESAVVNAVIDTGNEPTSYTFAYDTLADYRAGGNNTEYAGPFFADASTSLLAVSAPIGCYPSLTCPVDQSPLQPNTTYVVYVQTQPGVAGTYYLTQTLDSDTVKFSTLKLGTIGLSSKKVPVSSGKGTVGLSCSGAEPCHGSYKLTTRLHGSTVTCGSGRFSVGAGEEKSYKDPLKGKCLSALGSASNLQASGRVVITSTTDQPNVDKAVVLDLVKKTS